MIPQPAWLNNYLDPSVWPRIDPIWQQQIVNAGPNVGTQWGPWIPISQGVYSPNSPNFKGELVGEWTDVNGTIGGDQGGGGTDSGSGGGGGGIPSPTSTAQPLPADNSFAQTLAALGVGGNIPGPAPSVNPILGTTLYGPNPTISAPFRHLFNQAQVDAYGIRQPAKIYNLEDGTITSQKFDWWKPQQTQQ